MWPFRKKQPVKKEFASAVDDRSWTTIFDWKPGAWQQHAPYDTENSVLAYPTVFSCQTLIASDISKLKIQIQRENNGIWEALAHPLLRLLNQPNGYQNAIQFLEAWMLSKLSHGNTYILKMYGPRRQLRELHVLDPLKVTPLVSESGDVFYRLSNDKLKQVEEGDVVVPASEIIHDRFNCLYHPLIGLSPIFAAGTAATTGLTNMKDTKSFIANGSNPGGVLTAPGPISDSTAQRLKEYWNANFKGEKSGNIAVAGDGLKFEAMRMSSADAQILELLGWNDEKICSVYHVPGYMVGVGSAPSHNNIEALQQSYYSQCLQILIESLELCLGLGISLEEGHRIQLDITSGLFRMDTSTLVKTLTESMKGIMSPDEAREKLNLPPVPGGAFPYLQQQNYSLEALAQRDATNPLGAPQPEPAVTDSDEEETEKALAFLNQKVFV